MYHQRLLSGMWWTGAESVKVMRIQRFGRSISLVRIRFIRPYVVGDSEHVGEMLRVAAVTKPKSPADQLEDLLRRLLANMAAPVPVPAPVPEVPTVEKLLQRLVAETLSRQSAALSPPEPVGLGNLIRSYLSGQQTSGPQTRQRPIRREWNGVVCFSCRNSGHAATRCPALDESFASMLPGWRAESTPGGFI